jgi:hypothetical protein
MSGYYRVSLIFLCIGAVFGLFLRLHIIFPLPLLNYSNVLHGHSHIMFLGWVFNVLYIGFTVQFIPKQKQRFFKIVFWIIQFLNVGMLVSFPLQGYGAYSITFSTLHTVFTFVYIARFFVITKNIRAKGLVMARISLLSCSASAAGPFALAFVMANELQQTQWYNYAIFYYLHFQYNGFFFFGILSLYTIMFKGVNMGDTTMLRKSLNAMIAALVPTFFLSILYGSPGFFFNVIGFAGALMQVLAYFWFIQWLRVNTRSIREGLGSIYNIFLLVVACLGCKFLLQLLSAFPSLAEMAYSLRPVLIAYLHLVLVGIITISLLIWLQQSCCFRKLPVFTLRVLIVSFLTMEIALVAQPWWPSLLVNVPATIILLISSIGLCLASMGFLIKFQRGDNDHLYS